MSTLGFIKTSILGNVGNDIEVAMLPDQKTTVINFSMAINSRRKDPNDNEKVITQVTWVSVRAFGRIAEILNQYVKKGDLLHIDAEYRIDNYTTQAGEKRSKHYFIVRDFALMPNNRKPENNVAGSENLPASEEYSE